MKRKIFFWLTKLKITRTERRAISYLLLLLAVLVLMNMISAPASPFDKKYYKALDQQFRKRTAAMRLEHRKKLARYKRQSLIAVSIDTTDSLVTQNPETGPEESKQGTLININRADSQTLQQLKGIGAVYAQRIITYRKKNGKFRSKRELQKIKGIGPARLQNISPQITLGDIDTTSQSVITDSISFKNRNKPSVAAASSDEQQLININKADIKMLKQLPGVGPAYARRIVAYRQKNGAFTTKDELLKIKGIGKKRLAKIKAFIKLTGQQ